MARPDSRIIGAYNDGGDELADLIGDLVGDDDIADLIADLLEGDDDGMGEIGRRRRRAKRKAKKFARRSGQSLVTREEAAQVRARAKLESLRATNAEAMATGDQMTAGHYVADGGQRVLYLPFSGTVSIGNTGGSTGILRANVQRPMSIHRIVLDAVDSTTGADVIGTLGVLGAYIGVDAIFNANGVSPARAFSYNAVGVALETKVARVGNEVSVNLSRIVGLTNPATVSGYVVGISAEF